MSDDERLAYYHTLRRIARSRTVDNFNRHIKSPDDREIWRGLTLGSINPQAIEYATEVWPRYYDPSSWNGFGVSWEKLAHQFLPKYSNFNIAVWQEIDEQNYLQGMAFGKCSKGKDNLTINFVERSFAPNYFKGGVLLPILGCAEEYATLLQVKRILIKDPLDEKVYEKYDYTDYPGIPGGAKYLAKEI